MTTPIQTITSHQWQMIFCNRKPVWDASQGSKKWHRNSFQVAMCHFVNDNTSLPNWNYHYRGEFIFQSPDNSIDSSPGEIWKKTQAYCFRSMYRHTGIEEHLEVCERYGHVEQAWDHGVMDIYEGSVEGWACLRLRVWRLSQHAGPMTQLSWRWMLACTLVPS